MKRCSGVDERSSRGRPSAAERTAGLHAVCRSSWEKAVSIKGGNMDSAAEERSVHLAGSVLDRARHVCAFFHTRDEEYRVLMPFIAEGFEHGDRAFHIVDPNHRQEHMQRLQDGGIDADAAEQRGQLTVLRWQDAYLRGGHFDQNAMLALIE